MSNKFDAKEINDQIDKLKPNLEIALTDLQGVGNSVTAILNNGEFTGKFATNVKSYYSEVHGKAIEVLHTLIDAVNTAGDKLKQNAQTVDSDGNAKIVTDYLLNEQTRDMQSVQEAYTHHKSAIQAQVSSISDIVGISMPSENVGDATEQAKRELKNIAQKVDEFANQSVVDEITSLLGSLDSLMGYMDGCQTAGGPGKYQAGDLGKQPFYADIDKNVEKVHNMNMSPDQKKEREFWKNLSPELQAEMNNIINDETKTSEEKKNLLVEFLKAAGQSQITDKFSENTAKSIIDKLYVSGFEAYFAGAMKVGITDGTITLTGSVAKSISVKASEEGIEISTSKLAQSTVTKLTEEGLEKIETKIASNGATKVGSKALGPVIGGVVSTGINIMNGDDPAKAVTKAAVGTAVGLAVDYGVSAGATALLLPIAGPLAPVLGKGIGFVAGVGASMITDAIIDRYWDDPIGQASKDLQSVGNTIGNVANNVGNAITSIIPPLPKLGWW